MNKILMLLALMLVVGIVVRPVETFLEEETMAFEELVVILNRGKAQTPLLENIVKSALRGNDVLHGDISCHLWTKYRLLSDGWRIGV